MKGKKKLLSTFIVSLMAALLIFIPAVATPQNAEAATASNVGTTITSVKFKQTSLTLKVGESKGLAVSYSYRGPAPAVTKTLTWTSSNSKVATVKNGWVTAKSIGTATITVNLNGKTATCKVTVKKADNRFIPVSDAYTSVNSIRKEKNLKALKRDANLEKSAKKRAEEMAKTGIFSHTRPNGKSGLTLIQGNLHKGENIAKGQRTCAEVVKAWYNSAGHRENMLRKQFTKTGIAGYSYNGVIYWVQLFSS